MVCQRSTTQKKSEHMKVYKSKIERKASISNKFKKREKSYLELTSFTSTFSIPYTCTLDHGCMNCLLILIQSLALQNIWCKYVFSIKELVFFHKIIKTPDVKLSKECVSGAL
jgi:hypothetical protein